MHYPQSYTPFEVDEVDDVLKLMKSYAIVRYSGKSNAMHCKLHSSI